MTIREKIARAHSGAVQWFKDARMFDGLNGEMCVSPDVLMDDLPDMLTSTLFAALDEAGYAVVPKEPTKAMLEAGEKASNDTHDGSMTTDGWEDCWDDMKIAANVYRAMLTAAKDWDDG